MRYRRRQGGLSFAWWLVILAVAAVAVASLWMRGEKGVSVEVTTATRGTVSESLDEDGLVRSDVEVAIRPQVPGKIERFHVKSGDRVRPGQLVVTLDSAETRAALEQAQAQESVARAAVAEAQAALVALREKSAAELDNAQAVRNQSYYSYRKAQDGSRPEEVERAASVVRQAEAHLRETEADYQRKVRLFAAKVVSRRELETSEAQHRMAQASVQEARQNQLMAQRGPRWEDKGAARAELQRGQAQVRMAQAQEQQIELSQRQYESAQLRVETAAAEARRARALLDKSSLKAPKAGIIELENLQVGDTCGLTTTIGRVIDPAQVWVEILVDESDRGKIQLGQGVDIVCDAYPGQSFKGLIKHIDSLAFLKRELRNSPTQDEDRVFRARVNVEGARGKLYPGMSVFAEIFLSRHDNLLVVPRQALLQREGHWYLFVAEAGKARQRDIKIGRRDANVAEILDGLGDGDQVILNPNAVADGKPVTPRVRVSASPTVVEPRGK